MTGSTWSLDLLPLPGRALPEGLAAEGASTTEEGGGTGERERVILLLFLLPTDAPVGVDVGVASVVSSMETPSEALSAGRLPSWSAVIVASLVVVVVGTVGAPWVTDTKRILQSLKKEFGDV